MSDDPNKPEDQSGGQPPTDGGDPMDEMRELIDMEEAMKNPFGAAMKLMSDPKARAAMESFMGSSQGQQMMGEAMNNPMLRGMMNNPMMQKMMGGGMDLSGLFGGMPGMAPGPVSEASEDFDEPEVEPVLDEPKIPILVPQRGGPAFPPGAPSTTIESLCASPELAAAVEDLGGKRLRHHLTDAEFGTLSARANEASTTPVGRLIDQGAFMGELAWYSIVQLEESFESEVFVPLARHALSCVTKPSGYCVPSFVTQLLAFLFEEGVATDNDVRHVVWALSGQPEDGVDGVFELDGDDALALIEEAGKLGLSTELLSCFVAVVGGWSELEGEGVELSGILDALADEVKEPVLHQLLDLVGNNLTIESVKGGRLSESFVQDLAKTAVRELSIDAVVRLGAKWTDDATSALRVCVARSLDMLWHETTDESRAALLAAVLKHPAANIRQEIFDIAAAWEPHTYLALAEEDADDSIRSWAEAASRSLG